MAEIEPYENTTVGGQNHTPAPQRPQGTKAMIPKYSGDFFERNGDWWVKSSDGSEHRLLDLAPTLERDALKDEVHMRNRRATQERKTGSRAAFESWVKESGSFTDWSRYGEGYAKPLVDRTWRAWCAAVEWARACLPK